MVGCRFNAKNTLDKNCLYLAEGLGAEIKPEQEVDDIRLLPDGCYQLIIRKSTGLNRPSQKLRTQKLILSGGAERMGVFMGFFAVQLGCVLA